jgi:hypothetical protein
LPFSLPLLNPSLATETVIWILLRLAPQKITRLQLNLMHASDFSPVAGTQF